MLEMSQIGGNMRKNGNILFLLESQGQKYDLTSAGYHFYLLPLDSLSSLELLKIVCSFNTLPPTVFIQIFQPFSPYTCNSYCVGSPVLVCIPSHRCLPYLICYLSGLRYMRLSQYSRFRSNGPFRCFS